MVGIFITKFYSSMQSISFYFKNFLKHISEMAEQKNRVKAHVLGEWPKTFNIQN